MAQNVPLGQVRRSLITGGFPSQLTLDALQEPPMQQQKGAPYAPPNAGSGGIPNIGTDVPVTSVFLAIFIVGAITHMTIFQLNKKKGHKFILSGLMFGFCMARITTCVMRIAWATRPNNIRLAIAAMIFVSAGVVLLFIINLIFAQRMIRALHPPIGWHKVLGLTFKVLYALHVITLVMVIVGVVQSFHTLSRRIRRIDRGLQLYGSTFFAISAFLPIPLVIAALVKRRKAPIDKFGSGRFRTKTYILLTSAALLTLGAGFRVGTGYHTPRARNNPAWYHSKACFYIFNLLVEAMVIYLYAFIRVDQRFHVPDGASAPGHYSRGKLAAVEARGSEDTVANGAPHGQHDVEKLPV